MAEPTDLEQLVIELINRARSDPEAEAERLGIDLNGGLPDGTITSDPKQPLAGNLFLTDSARQHSQWMIDNDIFSHTGVNGSNPQQRMANAGYVFSGNWTWGENVAWRGTTGILSDAQRETYVYAMHDALVVSPGHRENIMDPGFREIGVGEATGTFTKTGTDFDSSMLTENFARSGTAYFLTGVVYDDLDGDAFYSPGEGMGSVSVTIDGAGTATWSSGGYSVAYSGGGAQTITFSGGGLAAPVTVDALVGGENVKIDLIDRDTVQTSTSVRLVSGAINVIHLGLYGGGSIGNDSANTMTGGTGVDLFSALGGNDVLFGNKGDDSLGGDAGDDSLEGGAGADTLDGGVGSDTATYATSDAGVTVVLGVSVAGGHATGDLLIGIEHLAGSAHADTLTGDSGANRIAGGAGDDVLAGGAGADTLDGGAGNDTADYSASAAAVAASLVAAGAGGDAAGDTLTSIEGIIGTLFGDTLTGNGFANTLEGLGGNDTLLGGAGSDLLFGGSGNDSLIGGDGSDSLFGGSGNDTFDGGTGADVFFLGEAGDVVSDGGSGFDKVQINNPAGVSLSVGTWLSVERFNGFNGNDTINATGATAGLVLDGREGSDTLIGGNGNDVIFGGAGNDSLIGGAGSDMMLGGDGNDSFEGGAGNDVFFIGQNGDVVIDAGAGFDKVAIDNPGGVSISVGTWANLERVNGFTGDDVVDATGLSNGIVLDGRDGDDTLIGGEGNDVLIGGAGNDSLIGGNGDDIMLGGSGNDSFDGGAGDDLLFVDAPGDIVFDGGAGSDKVQITKAAGLSLAVGGWLNVERINGFTGADTIDATGSAAGLTIDGRSGNDILTGGSGNDLIFAGEGDDSLAGAAGDDGLIAGSGIDTLNGGAGDDFLQGGSEADVFVFTAGWGTDTLQDWQDGSDKLDFSGHAGVTVIGNLTIAQVDTDTHVTFGADSIILVGVTATEIDVADFLFGP